MTNSLLVDQSRIRRLENREPGSGRYDPARRLSFVHVPKSAGTSLTRALGASLKIKYRTGWDRSAFGGFEDFQSIKTNLRNSIWLSSDNVPQDRLLLAGHVSVQTFLDADENTQFLTLFREPLSRLLSLWIFWRRGPDVPNANEPWGSFADRVWLARKKLLDFVNDPFAAFATDNAATRLLLYPHPCIPADDFIHPDSDDRLFEEAVARLDKFDFVDLVENVRWMQNLSDWLGHSIDVGRDNVTNYVCPPFRSKLAGELSHGAFEKLRHRVRIDDLLWRHVAERHMTKHEADGLKLATFSKTVANHAIQMQPEAASTVARPLAAPVTPVPQTVGSTGMVQRYVKNLLTRRQWRIGKIFFNALPGFDPAYYLRWYTDVRTFKDGPMAHYVLFGWKEGRDPSAAFSTIGYLNANPDVLDLGICPLIHFAETGMAEGRTGWKKTHASPPPPAGSHDWLQAIGSAPVDAPEAHPSSEVGTGTAETEAASSA